MLVRGRAAVDASPLAAEKRCLLSPGAAQGSALKLAPGPAAPPIRPLSCSVSGPHELLVAAVTFGDLTQTLLPQCRHVRVSWRSWAAPGPGPPWSGWP